MYAALVAVLGNAPLALAGDDLPVVAAIKGARVQWVSPDMTYDGLAMTIRRFRTRRPPEAVMDYHRRQWSQRWPGSETVGTKRDGWNIVSIRPEGLFVSVRVRAVDSESAGYITVSDNPTDGQTGSDSLYTELPLPHGVELRNRQTFDDGGRRAEHLRMYARSAPGSLAARFRRRLEDEDWRVVEHRRLRDRGDGSFWLYQRDSQQLHLQFQRATGLGPGTSVLSTWMK